MFSFCRKQIPILLSMLLTFTLVVNGFGGERGNAVSRAKALQLHQDMPFVMSTPALEFKSSARKETSSGETQVSWSAGHGVEFGLRCSSSRLEGEESANLALEALRAVRARPPPMACLS